MMQVCILGTGNYAKALAKRLVGHGYEVTCGSRNPRSRSFAGLEKPLASVQVMSIGEAINTADIVIVAWHYEQHSDLRVYAEKLQEKIVIDVSNPNKSISGQSLAERMQSYIPRSRVIKAFNTISAYRLDHDESGQSTALPVCGDDSGSKHEVIQIGRNLGFDPYDAGNLQKAIEQENKVLELFPGWWIPLLISVISWIFWFIYAMLHHFVYLTYRAYTPERIPVNISNKAFACTAITNLALVFLPGCIAAFVQMYRGTKHKPFHWILDRWLKVRKQFGLLALGCVIFHAVLSLAILDPSYFRTLYLDYRIVVPAQPTADTRYGIGSRMNWNGETLVFLGMLAAFLMLCLGITSIPSVSRMLNWREWNFAQSKLGMLCLLIATAHLNVKGIPSWLNEPFGVVVKELSFVASLLPWIVLAMRLILVLPCIRNYVLKIRNGWERTPVQADPESGHQMNGIESRRPGFENPSYK